MLSWLWIAYLFAFAALNIGGIVDDVQSRRPRWQIGCAVIAFLFSVLFVLALSYPMIATRLGGFVAAMLIFVLLSDFHSVASDADRLEASRDTSKTELALAVAAVAGLSLPAYIAGLILTVRTFSA